MSKASAVCPLNTLSLLTNRDDVRRKSVAKYDPILCNAMTALPKRERERERDERAPPSSHSADRANHLTQVQQCHRGASGSGSRGPSVRPAGNARRARARTPDFVRIDADGARGARALTWAGDPREERRDGGDLSAFRSEQDSGPLSLAACQRGCGRGRSVATCQQHSERHKVLGLGELPKWTK